MSPLRELVGKQTRAIHLASDRDNVVLGTAGTGKSTMAVARAVHLADPDTANSGPTLLLTYNNALITYLKYLVSRHVRDVSPGSNIPNLTIETYSAFARNYLLSRRVLEPSDDIANGKDCRLYVDQAVGRLRREDPLSPTLRRDIGWFVDELQWIAGMGLPDEHSYQTIRRRGRQTQLRTGIPRSQVWRVLELYRNIRRHRGRRFDWIDIASAVRETQKSDTTTRQYRHILIDEGQDLTPEMIRTVAAAARPGGSVTFFGDYHQAIYGQGLSWRAAGLRLDGRPVERFVDNYRNTIPIARLMTAIAQSKYMASDDEDLVVPGQAVLEGVSPTLIRCQDLTHEAKTVRRLVADLARDQSVAVLCRTWGEATRAVAGLRYTELKTGMDSWHQEPGIYSGPYHSGKGLEFDVVVLPFLNDDRIPLPSALASFGHDEACAREARLLYVSASRARSRLVMTYSDTLTRLMPSEESLWEEVIRA
ncbi:3'-5' exonuclease [Nocardia australiensis]|uniref:3'-5' exonuclease n=1 Tax=Nocardia australiensis TaxID=2887191 RepID=UPI001D150239|nr:3'-5' exonuclease [Nocardia australiensis]